MRVVLQADRGRWQALSSAWGDLSPKCLGEGVGVGDERPIVVDGVDFGVDVDRDLVTEV